MKTLLLVVTALVAGCAHIAPVAPSRGDGDVPTTAKANARPAQASSSGRTQTIGLPLSRGGKIGLWAGVAVFLAYLMESDGEDGAGPTEP